MSDLISREWLLKQPLDTSNYPSNYVKSAPSADIMECARAIKEYCINMRDCRECFMYYNCFDTDGPDDWILSEEVAE